MAKLQDENNELINRLGFITKVGIIGGVTAAIGIIAGGLYTRFLMKDKQESERLAEKLRYETVPHLVRARWKCKCDKNEITYDQSVLQSKLKNRDGSAQVGTNKYFSHFNMYLFLINELKNKEILISKLSTHCWECNKGGATSVDYQCRKYDRLKNEFVAQKQVQEIKKIIPDNPILQIKCPSTSDA